MRGSGLAALFLLFLLAAALSSCSAKPASLEWPRGSTEPSTDYSQLTLNVESVTDVSAPEAYGELVLKVVDANGTGVKGATVFAFSSEEVVFDSDRSTSGEDGTVRFNFTVLVMPYPGMAVVASAMKANHTDASALVQIVAENLEPPVQDEAASPSDSVEGIAIAAAGAVGLASVGLYFYWNRGM